MKMISDVVERPRIKSSGVPSSRTATARGYRYGPIAGATAWGAMAPLGLTAGGELCPQLGVRTWDVIAGDHFVDNSTAQGSASWSPPV